jgi:anti-anti-sigma regulatory factor
MTDPKATGTPILQYFIAEKNSVLVLSWIGTFAHAAISIIEECQAEMNKTQAKCVIMNCRDLSPAMDRSAVPVLAKLQKTIREKPAVLRLSSVHPELLSFLEFQGLIRKEEVALNLTEAIQSLAKLDGNK